MTPKKMVRLISAKTMSWSRDDDDEEGVHRTGSSNHEEDYMVERPRERLKSSRGKQFDMLVNELNQGSTEFCREGLFDGLKDLYHGLAIHPEKNRWYKAWDKFILLWAVYSSFFTPMEFGFFCGLPENLFVLDIVGQVAFLVDIVLRFFVGYRDKQTYHMVHKRRSIAFRYLKSTFILDLLACFPWDLIYKASHKKEIVRYMLWIRLCRVRKITFFLQKMEKDIRIKYLITRIIKLLTVELYCTHTAACIFYYLATTIPESQEGYTWIGSLTLGDYSYSHFREIDIWKRYTTSLYFSIVTMATVGYGDIHAVNMREMIFIMIYVSFDMILGAYLIGNMTALIVKGSQTERFRDKMAEVMKYMYRNRLDRDLRNQIKSHLRLQYESSYTEASVLNDIPISLRAKISQTLYMKYIENAAIFKGCSIAFMNQIVTRVHEEFFLPGEVILEQGNVVDQLYIVCHGKLEEVVIEQDGSEKTISHLELNSTFGQISIFGNIPQTCTVRVIDLCRLLRIDKQSLSNIIDIYFYDGKKIFDNLLEGNDGKFNFKEIESDIASHIEQHESELALKVNNAAYRGDLYQLKNLIGAGADPKKTDYNKRSPLHIAASQGHENIILFLIQEGADVNQSDDFGNTPLLDAVKNGHDRVAELLYREGARIDLKDVGTFLCTVVLSENLEFLKRLVNNGVDPNSRDYDRRTPLHVACSHGLYLMAKFLVEAGALVLLKDRWGYTPLDESKMCGHNSLIKLLESAKSTQQSEFGDHDEEIPDKKLHKKCTVFPYHPFDAKENRTPGIVLWIPRTIDELVKAASEKLNIPTDSCVLSEDGGKLLDIEMIDNGQKLYLISETE
ncbi:potassium channel SKOR-like [Chenopodium quinoa]|uniref:potassium channel SKOR-like n=1 Tax=Chenopodium quinoa TaxID=63459 RepID=UPI000B77C7FF|nr:potassium channel SKOR-like [Chenopodium quinoa]